MNGRILLDTNIVIALFGQDVAVQQRLRGIEEVFIPSIVLGELYYGSHKSTNVDANVARIDEFAHRNSILPCDTITAQHYGHIKNGLRVKGRPIPENDIWIAALCAQHELTLATRDEHFREIDSISIETW